MKRNEPRQSRSSSVRLPVTTSSSVPPYRTGQVLGLVGGSVVYSRNVATDVGQAFKNLIGGELRSYTKLLSKARDVAVERLVADAEALGASGVIDVRFGTSDVAMGAVEIFAYGTAVILEPNGSE